MRYATTPAPVRVLTSAVRAVACAVFVAIPGMAASQAFPSVVTIAGSGAFGIPGGPLARSPFMEPFGVAVAPDGRIFVSDYAAQRIVQIDRAHGLVRVVAGSGAVDATGLHVEGGFRNGPALSARFNGPTGLAFDGDDLLIADSRNHCIRRLRDGVVSSFAGACGGGLGNAAGRAAPAPFALPMGLVATPDGMVYVADSVLGVRMIAPNGDVSAVNVPGTSALGVTYDARRAIVYVAAADGIYGVRNGAYVNGLKFGGPGPTYAPFGYPAGHPFGIASLGEIGLLYTDVETGALRYLGDFSGSTEVLSGSGEGGDFRRVGRASGPLSDHSFVAPLGLAVAPDRSIVVADSQARTVRRIEPWLAQPISAPTARLIPVWKPRHYRIAYIGNSTIWTGTTWYDSIENRLQTQLDTPAFRAAHGQPQVQPFWLAGGIGFSTASDYGTFLAENHLVDAIVMQQSTLSMLNGAIKAGSPCARLDFGTPWTTSEASSVRLGEAATKEHVPIIGVIAPAAFDVSPSEQISLQFSPSYVGRCLDELPAQSRQFRAMTLALFKRAHFASVDLWPGFRRAERQPDSRPLFGSFDAHYTAAGRRLAADTILPVLVRAIAER